MILEGHIDVPTGAVAFFLARAGRDGRTRKMSAAGPSWRTEIQSLPDATCLRAVLLISRAFPGRAFLASKLLRVQWWANVVYPGAAFEAHAHIGSFSFVQHLTRGAATIFQGETRPYPAKPGQLLVFPSTLRHSTGRVNGPEPRVSIAGNLWFEGGAK